MKRIARNSWRIVRVTVFAIVVGYMIAWHNVYREDQKLAADIAISIDEEDESHDGAPL